MPRISAVLSILSLILTLAGPAAAEPLAENFNGLRVNAELKLAPDKTLADGVVLMMPSPLGHHRMELIVNAQDLLVENGVSTLAPSLSLGHDNRRWYLDCGSEIRYTADGIFDEIDFWVRWLKDHGAPEVTLLGHSLSANVVTMYMTRRAPAAVNGVILLAPATLAYGPQGIKRYEGRFKVSLAEALARADRYIAAGKGGEPMPEATDFYFCPAARVTPDAFVSQYRDQMSQDFPALWGAMPTPTLMIVGTGDKRSPEIIEEAARAKATGEVQVVTIENGGHFFKGLYTDNAVRAMVDFIAEVR